MKRRNRPMAPSTLARIKRTEARRRRAFMHRRLSMLTELLINMAFIGLLLMGLIGFVFIVGGWFEPLLLPES